MQQSVVLINPPLSLQDRYGKDMQKFGAVSEPLGLLILPLIWNPMKSRFE